MTGEERAIRFRTPLTLRDPLAVWVNARVRAYPGVRVVVRGGLVIGVQGPRASVERMAMDARVELSERRRDR